MFRKQSKQKKKSTEKGKLLLVVGGFHKASKVYLLYDFY